MHPITSHMQAQLVGQDRLRTANAARRARSLAPPTHPRTRVSTPGLVRRVLTGSSSAPACAPGDLTCTAEASA